MKYITKGFVSEMEAGERLAEVVGSDICKKSGVYWSWNGGGTITKGGVAGAGGSGGEIFENQPSGIHKKTISKI
jgi:hypothetical protein